MKSLVTLALVCMLLPKADALTCYTCVEPTNCDKFEKMTCPTGTDRCLSATATERNKKFTMKMCTLKQVCDASQSFPGMTLENIKCCQTELCNGAESFTLSFLLMFIPLLSSTLFY